MTFFVCMFLQSFIENKNRVYIGVMRTLSEDDSGIGLSFQNGILMGSEEFNKNRNFYKKKLHLLIRDDKNDSKEAVKGAKELVDEGVVAILGPVLPEVGLSIMEVGNNREIPVISSAFVNEEVSKKDDYFISMAPSPNKIPKSLAKISKVYFNMKKVLIIYSEKPPAYTEFFKDEYLKEFTSGRGTENTAYIKTSAEKINEYFPSMKDEIDGVIVVASRIETAYIVQNIKRIKKDEIILVSDLAFDQDLITYGGKFSEGVYSALYYDQINLDQENSDLYKNFLDFKESYREKYGKEPDSSAIYGYESFTILANAIKRNKGIDSKSLKKEILSPESSKYFLQPGRIDEYGDCERYIFVFQVNDKKFKKIELR